MHGKGVLTCSDGRSYSGFFLNDKKHFHGVYHWANGNEYEGEWFYGKQDGYGVFREPYEKKSGFRVRYGIW
jgi:hypothetical protein